MKFPRYLFPILLFFGSYTQGPAQIARVDEVESPASAKINRDRGLSMLEDIKEVLKARYYDKNFKGIDLDARFKTAAERVKTLDTNRQIFRAIAQVLIEFDDSHTRFFPPNRANKVEYGFTMQMIGNNCFVTDVKKGSDAEAKGLKTGERIKAVGPYEIARSNLWVINYLLYALDPQPGVSLTVVGLDNAVRKIDVMAKFKSIEDRKKEAEKRWNQKRENPYKCQEIDPAVIACRLETFSVDKKFIDQMMTEVSKHKKLILDLRGNGGGYVKIEEYLTGHFFDHEVKIADFITREKKKERIAKVQKERNFNGELVVLIDSNSASASEVFARVMQLEKRGKIVGDVSAGAVQTSNFFSMINSRGTFSNETLSVFALNVTVADLVMSDGNRLEKVGVQPDHPVGPTGYALSKRNDPILAFAANLLGAKITPEDAGKMNFLYKKEEDDEESDEGETDSVGY